MPPRLTRGFVTLDDGAKLSYWDTQREGAPVILLHPYSGTEDSFALQIEPIARAGYRVIGYSRRGYGRSEQGDKDQAGTQSGDLAALADFLVPRQSLHLVGVAAGGGVAIDFAMSHPNRLASLTIVNSLMTISDPDWREIMTANQPENLHDMPIEERELSPSFRVAFPEAVAEWRDHAMNNGMVGTKNPSQPHAHKASFAGLAKLNCPVLLITGKDDLFLPPALAKMAAQRIPGAQIEIIDKAAHAPQFERPDEFNRLLLNHFVAASQS